MIKMAIKGLVLGLLFCLLSLSSGEQLAPFVAWSNRDILNGMTQESSDLNQILSVLLPRAKDLELIVIFTTQELTFDDFNKQVGVYDESSSELEEAVQKSASSYWAGIRDTGTGDWVSRLASSRGTTVHRIRGSIRNRLNLNGVIVVELDSVDNQDAVIGQVMRQTDEKSFLAVYTSSLLKERRGRRDVPIMERDLEPRAAAATTENTDTCGSLKSNGSDECLLFCLIDAYVIYDIDGTGKINCTLDSSQANYTYCCNNDNAPECNNDNNGTTTTSTPYVTLSYPYNNDTCTGDYVGEGTISIKFLFNSDSSDYWSLSMNANITNESSLCLFDNMQMTRHESKLYYPFSISKKLSYACSALYYNNFTQNLTNTTSDCSPGSMISVVFKNLQVQPYNVSSSTFSTAYNCEGYFTATAWMGVVAVAILILILYLSIISIFSVQTIDKFEDPRGESINVEKLH